MTLKLIEIEIVYCLHNALKLCLWTDNSFIEFVKKTDPEGYAKMKKMNDKINAAIEAANKRADAMEEAEALKKKGRKLNAGGGLNYLMGL